MKMKSLICAMAVFVGFSTSAFAMRSDAPAEPHVSTVKCGLQPIALDPNGPIVRCY